MSGSSSRQPSRNTRQNPPDILSDPLPPTHRDFDPSRRARQGAPSSPGPTHLLPTPPVSRILQTSPFNTETTGPEPTFFRDLDEESEHEESNHEESSHNPIILAPMMGDDNDEEASDPESEGVHVYSRNPYKTPRESEARQYHWDQPERLMNVMNRDSLHTLQTLASTLTETKTIDPSRPSIFSGNISSDIIVFVKKCELVFLHSAAKFPNDKSKIAYAINLLDGSAFRWADSWIEKMNDPRDTSTWKDFKDEILAAFTDSNNKQIAMRKLTNARQVGSVSTYIAYFNTLIHDAGWNKINNAETLIQLFFRGLGRPLQQIIIMGGSLPKTLEEIQKTALEAESKRSLLEFNSFTSPPQRSFRPNYQPNFRVPQNYNMGKPQFQQFNRNTFQPRNAPPMYSNKRNISCYNCGKQGHIQRECRAPKQNRTGPSNRPFNRPQNQYQNQPQRQNNQPGPSNRRVNAATHNRYTPLDDDLQPLLDNLSFEEKDF